MRFSQIQPDIYAENYSPKSYVVNFHTQISSTQSEERTMVFTRDKKKIRPIRIANDVFSNGLFAHFAVSKENEGILESMNRKSGRYQPMTFVERFDCTLFRAVRSAKIAI